MLSELLKLVKKRSKLLSGIPQLINDEVYVLYMKNTSKTLHLRSFICYSSHTVGRARNLKTKIFFFVISRRRSRFLKCKTLYKHRNYANLV
jgi:hypothetical protein